MEPVSWNILLIDDDEEDYIITRQMLSDTKFSRTNMVWANTYEAGLEALAKGVYDAILVDYDLGTRSGLELTREVVAAGIPAPVILYTGRGSHEIDLEAMQAGATLYLTKGETTPLLLERGIRYAIERKQNEIALERANEMLIQQKEDLEKTNRLLNQSLQAHKLSEERFRSLFDSMGEGFALHEIITDEGGKPIDYIFLDINPAFERLTGLKREEVVGRLKSHIIPDDDAHWLQIYGDVALQGTPVHFENYSSALKRHYDVYAYSPAPRQFAVLFFDTTARHNIEELLRVNLTKYSTLFESIPIGVTLTDKHGNILEINQEAERLLQIPKSEHLQRQLTSKEWHILHPDGTPMPPTEFPGVKAISTNQRIDNVELGWVNTNANQEGEVTWLNVTAAPLPLDNYGALITYSDISARKNQEVLARRSLDQLRAVFDHFSEGLLVADSAGNILLINPAMDRFMGVPQAAPQSIFEYIHLFEAYDAEGKFIPHEEWPFIQALQGKSVRDVEIHLRYPGREDQYVALQSAEPVKDANGNVILVVLTVREITQRKLAENQILQRSLELQAAHDAVENEKNILEAVMEALPVGVAISDREGNLNTTNRAYKELLGVKEGGLPTPSHREMQAWWANSCIPVLPEEWASVQAVLTGKSVYGQLFEIQRSDGSRIFITNSAAPIRDASGEIAGSAAALYDVTQMRKIEQDLIEREKELRLIMDAEPVLISYIDSAYIYRRVNKSYERWFGVTAEESQGRHVRDVLGENAWQAVKPYMERALSGELVVYERELPYSGGGPRWVQVTYTPHRDEAGIIQGMVVHVADIGERIKTEKALKHYAEQLHRSNKELEEFAFVVSHDLKEPLRKIEKFGGQIYSRAAHRLPDEERDYLKRMISAAERMRKMIEDLLSLSRVTSSRQPFVDVDLNQVLKIVLEDLEVSIVQSHAEIILNDLPVVKADPLQMQLLMQNLIVNGLKFHKPGEPPRITIAAQSLGSSQFEIVVEDCGIGFDMHHAHKLFQPFQRLHGRSEYEGSGIGLAICRKIAERHSGLISASSQPGVGTRFTVLLPTDPAPLPG